jgi:hypothetical protein
MNAKIDVYHNRCCDVGLGDNTYDAEDDATHDNLFIYLPNVVWSHKFLAYQLSHEKSRKRVRN